MRKGLNLLILLAMLVIPLMAHATGCLWHHTVVGSVKPVKTPPPQTLPAKAPYALYWLFHTWCPSCQGQAEEIKAFYERYRDEVQIYAVPLSGSTGEVKSFLKQEGLATLPVVPAARAAFGAADTHPVLVFRKAKASYYRINGYTPFSELEDLFETFKQP